MPKQYLRLCWPWLDVYSLFLQTGNMDFGAIRKQCLMPRPVRAKVPEFRERARVASLIQEIDGTGVFWKKSS